MSSKDEKHARTITLRAPNERERMLQNNRGRPVKKPKQNCSRCDGKGIEKKSLGYDQYCNCCYQ